MFAIRVVLTLVFVASTAHQCVGLDVFDVFKLTKLVTVELFHAWELLSPETHEHPLPPFLRKDDAKLLGKIGLIQARVDAVDAEVKLQSAGIVDTLRRSLPQVVRNELRIANLMQILAEIDRKDKLLKVYRTVSENGSRSDSLWQFASSIISQDYNSVLSMWDRLHSTFMVPEMDGPSALPQTSILHQMADTVEELERRDSELPPPLIT